MRTLPLWLATLALAGLAYAPMPAQAAQSYDNCTGFIDTVPATITTQGTWCLRKDLSTAITTGSAITINTNNVTIDCNHFKLGGLQAGESSLAFGIHAQSRLNATVRHCNVRGFYLGIFLDGGGGHLLEDNRLDQNLNIGIYVAGDNNTVRRNAVYDTGGSPASVSGYGIYAQADVIDNTVAGVFGATNSSSLGITLYGDGTEARGNRVRGLVVSGSGFATGIDVHGAGSRIDGNHISAAATTAGIGIRGVGTNTFCSHNTVVNFATAYSSCEYTFGDLGSSGGPTGPTGPTGLP